MCLLYLGAGLATILIKMVYERKCKTKIICSICALTQFKSPSGVMTCENGHGDVEGWAIIDKIEMVK